MRAPSTRCAAFWLLLALRGLVDDAWAVHWCNVSSLPGLLVLTNGSGNGDLQEASGNGDVQEAGGSGDAQEADHGERVGLWPPPEMSDAEQVPAALGLSRAMAVVRGITSTSASKVRSILATVIFGLLIFLLAITIQWFNEERSVRVETLISRGLEECVSIDAMMSNSGNRGRLVHVQGRAVGAVPVVDPQFPGALVKHCLKLQSTVEVFEWTEGRGALSEGRDGHRQMPRFHKEWTTVHNDFMRSGKPIVENSPLPHGLCLGTCTTVCRRVELGAFVLTDEMVNSFHRFEPAMQRLPQSIVALGHTFHANREDGYYYMRPSGPVLRAPLRLFTDHRAGDIRVRFMCVPDCDATVAAVQCRRGGVETFLPYRVIPRAPWTAESQQREELLEQGSKHPKDARRESVGCMGSGPAVWRALCCPCKTIACCCSSEIVTEEIFFVSDQLDPVEKPFQWVVRRNPCRVWSFRLTGWAVMFLGSAVIVSPFGGLLRESALLRSYGGAAPLILAAIVTFSFTSLIMAAVCMCYRPALAVKWLVAVAIVLAVTLLWGGLGWKI